MGDSLILEHTIHLKNIFLWFKFLNIYIISHVTYSTRLPINPISKQPCKSLTSKFCRIRRICRQTAFPPFPTMFSKIFKTIPSEFEPHLTIDPIDAHFDASTSDSSENIVGKRAISIFHTMFSTQSDNCTPLLPYF